MIRRAMIAAAVGMALLVPPASAADVPAGRGPRAQARMDAATVESGNRRVQILSEVCRTPSRLRRCEPMSSALRRALERAIDRPITWVDERVVNGPEFWVFAPVEFDHGTATSEYAWWDRGTDGCRGGITYDWERSSGTWSTTTGIGWGACSARAS
jgi:hypothetical protein